MSKQLNIYLCKTIDRIRLTDIRRVEYLPITRKTGTMFGNCPVSELTGRFDKSRLYVTSLHGNHTMQATHDGVKARLRRLRQQEADKLEAIDAQIEELRKEREAVIKLAWKNGNTVTVKELTEKINVNNK